jgi:hypothetical protein
MQFIKTRLRGNNFREDPVRPGDMYFAPWIHNEGVCTAWNNCNDPRGHLMLMLPNGFIWDTDTRSENCALPHDHNHRCWVKTGTLENLSIVHTGETCQVGAGSIAIEGYHGHLIDGYLTL